MNRKCTCGAASGEKNCICGRRARVCIVVTAALLMLQGCASALPAPVVETRTVVEHVTLPAGLLTCAGEPAIGPYTLQSQVADYLVRLHVAYKDCRNDVAAIAQIENPSPLGK
jgi:hypothetical protein